VLISKPTQTISEREVPVDIHSIAGGVRRRGPPVLPPQPAHKVIEYTVYITTRNYLPIRGMGVLISIWVEYGNDVPVYIAQNFITPKGRPLSINSGKSNTKTTHVLYYLDFC
jgi:hypothetical protein